jgi:hypothetical protein
MHGRMCARNVGLFWTAGIVHSCARRCDPNFGQLVRGKFGRTELSSAKSLADLKSARYCASRKLRLILQELLPAEVTLSTKMAAIRNNCVRLFLLPCGAGNARGSLP